MNNLKSAIEIVCENQHYGVLVVHNDPHQDQIEVKIHDGYPDTLSRQYQLFFMDIMETCFGVQDILEDNVKDSKDTPMETRRSNKRDYVKDYQYLLQIIGSFHQADKIKACGSIACAVLKSLINPNSTFPSETNETSRIEGLEDLKQLLFNCYDNIWNYDTKGNATIPFESGPCYGELVQSLN